MPELVQSEFEQEVTMVNVGPGYQNIEKIRSGIQVFLITIANFLSNISFTLKKENRNLVSCNLQSQTFCLSLEEV